MSRLRQALFAILALLGALVALPSAHAGSLAGSEWKPLLIDGSPVPEDTRAFVRFGGQGRLFGFSGCTDLSADYQASDGRLVVGPLAAARTACEDRGTQHAAALTRALERARSYRRQGIHLLLFDACGRPVLELRQTDWD